MYIYDLCRRLRPQRTLEIGFAEGFSAMYFLAAAKSNGTGSHVAVDPFENQDWHGQGLQKVEESGMKDQFRFMDSEIHSGLAGAWPRRVSNSTSYLSTAITGTTANWWISCCLTL